MLDASGRAEEAASGAPSWARLVPRAREEPAGWKSWAGSRLLVDPRWGRREAGAVP